MCNTRTNRQHCPSCHPSNAAPSPPQQWTSLFLLSSLPLLSLRCWNSIGMEAVKFIAYIVRALYIHPAASLLLHEGSWKLSDLSVLSSPVADQWPTIQCRSVVLGKMLSELRNYDSWTLLNGERRIEWCVCRWFNLNGPKVMRGFKAGCLLTLVVLPLQGIKSFSVPLIKNSKSIGNVNMTSLYRYRWLSIWIAS